MIGHKVKLHPKNTHNAVVDFMRRIKVPRPIQLYFMFTFAPHTPIDNINIDFEVPPQ